MNEKFVVAVSELFFQLIGSALLGSVYGWRVGLAACFLTQAIRPR